MDCKSSFQYIFDPVTGTRVSILTDYGVQILKQYAKMVFQQGGRSPPKAVKLEAQAIATAKATGTKTATAKAEVQASTPYAPSKYFTGLTPEEKKLRLQRIKQGARSDHKDPQAYKPFDTDFRNGVRIKTKPSQYTLQFNKIFPDAKSLQKKAKKTGVPISIIRKVYKRGLAAWRTGHRPGANAQQWGYARVHSFLVKGKTFYTADKDLAQKALQNNTAALWFSSVAGLCDKLRPDAWCPTKQKRQ